MKLELQLADRTMQVFKVGEVVEDEPERHAGSLCDLTGRRFDRSFVQEGNECFCNPAPGELAARDAPVAVECITLFHQEVRL
jgi:hypothetical protein